MSNGSMKMENDLVRDEIWHYFIGLRLYLWLALNAVNQGNVNIRELTLKKEQYIRFLSDLKDDLSYVVERGLKKVPIMTISKAIKHLEYLRYIRTKEIKYGFYFTILPIHNEAEKIGRTKAVQNWDEFDTKVVTDKDRKIERKEDDDEKTAEQRNLAKQQEIAQPFLWKFAIKERT
ncbi:hypothetical protein [Bacillus seohaeanensis]|uniref:Replication protein n=1 Tax=Bacillus seohaeanensis TaxID=284580 RepID=A0ABW5RVM5_9BACI